MKRFVIFIAVFVVVVSAIITSLVFAQNTGPVAPNQWVWPKDTTVAQVIGGCCDEQVKVLEGKIGDQTNANWNEYDFLDGTGTITLDFEDEIPAEAIPQNVIVHLIGKVKNNSGFRKFDVYGLETVGPTSATPNATVQEVNTGNLKDQEVAVEGQFGEKDVTTPWDPSWNWYKFSDGGHTTIGDLENDLLESQVPKNRTLLFYGEVDEFFGTPKIDARLILVYGSGAPASPTADFSGAPTDGSIPLTVNFTDLSTGSPTSWAWDFGDGNTSTTQNPSHTYTASGSYTVTLTATNSIDSDSEVKVNYITASDSPPPGANKPVFLPFIVKRTGQAPPPSGWVWEMTATANQINGGCCDEQVEVVEGKIGAQTNPGWNEYQFTDVTGSLTLDFEDEIPGSAIPQNSTVRIIGKVKQDRKLDVFGLQILGAAGAPTNATVQAINAGNFDGDFVGVIGQFGSKDPNAPFPEWNWYFFSDTDDTTIADLENDLTNVQIPKNHTLILYGEVKDYFGQTKKVDSKLMLFASDIP